MVFLNYKRINMEGHILEYLPTLFAVMADLSRRYGCVDENSLASSSECCSGTALVLLSTSIPQPQHKAPRT